MSFVQKIRSTLEESTQSTLFEYPATQFTLQPEVVSRKNFAFARLQMEQLPKKMRCHGVVAVRSSETVAEGRTANFFIAQTVERSLSTM